MKAFVRPAVRRSSVYESATVRSGGAALASFPTSRRPAPWNSANQLGVPLDLTPTPAPIDVMPELVQKHVVQVEAAHA